MAKINISPKAIDDMRDIKKYISDELLNETAAQNLLNDIYSKIERLKEFPLIGSPLFGKVEIQNEYRFLISGNYMIFHRFENDNIYIVRVLYGKSDYMKILFE